MDEARVIRLIQEGEARHFSVLYETYVEKIYRFLYYRTFHKETAEDLTSKTFLKALERMDKYDPEKGQFSTWLFRVARNTLFDHFRTEREALDIEEAWDIGREDGTKEAIDMRAELEKVKKEMQNLPEDQQEIVKLRLWDELSHKEIAELTGKTEGACKTAYSRAIKSIKEHL